MIGKNTKTCRNFSLETDVTAYMALYAYHTTLPQHVTSHQWLAMQAATPSYQANLVHIASINLHDMPI